MARVSVYTIGNQPCENFKRGDADVAAMGEGNGHNTYQCPVCWGRRAWCDNCNSDHHEHGWDTCHTDAYREREEAEDQPPFGHPEWVDQKQE